jgi:hypothetical protein
MARFSVLGPCIIPNLENLKRVRLAAYPSGAKSLPNAGIHLPNERIILQIFIFNKIHFPLRLLQNSPFPSAKAEIRNALKNWIPGRAPLARNDDFLHLSRALPEAPL